jgi:phage FluMu gp28-like protein
VAHRGYNTPVSKQRVRPGQSGPRAEAAIAEIALVESGVLDDDPVELEHYQRFFMARPERFRCVEKARQTGFSWCFAAEAVARTHMRRNHKSVFVSYNLDDAKEKIEYARQIADALPNGFKKSRTKNSKTELAFTTPSGGSSRIISLPCKAPRGKAKADVYLDEFAHYMDDKSVYKGTTALIARHPGAQLTIASTPAGRRGMFWMIARQETDKKWPRYVRFIVPWWLCRAYCTDIAAALADGIKDMPTVERVAKWGTEALQEQFDSLLMEDFQQEFEVAYIDEAHSFYSWDLINSCARDIELYNDSIDWDVTGRLTLGYDVGRKRDLSAMCIIEEISGHRFVRYLNMWERMPFEEQRLTIMEAMENLPIAQCRIDANGMGIQLAEELTERYGEDKILSCTFSQPDKELMATDLKILMEKRNITIPRHRDLLVQMHSIRKKTGLNKKPMFDSEKNAKHHGDLFWATALAARKDRSGVKPPPITRFRARVIGA